MLSRMLLSAANDRLGTKTLTLVNKTVLSLGSNGNSSITINTPVGTQLGDIIIAVSTSVNRANGHTASDFTQWFYCGGAGATAGSPKTTVLYNILTAAPASSYTFTITSGYGSTVYLALFTFRPARGAVSVGNFARNTAYNAASTTATAPTVTGTVDNFLFRLYSTGAANTFSTLSGFTIIDSTTNNNSTLLVNKTITVGGAQGTLNNTLSSSQEASVASFVLNVA